jgi:dTDP-4-amino-4,6-dideoxygalactose transaminase
MKIPFNKPHLTHKEMGYISNAHSLGQLSGDGYYTKLCHKWLEKNLKAKKSLLTHSCTAALEMTAILSDLSPGDEVIMPSFTFVSTANAFVLRGAVPMFVDIRPDTLNIDEKLIEKAITKKTKAIVAVHYAGVACEMDAILRIAKKHKLIVIEDAAQGFLAKYKGKNLGTIGDMGTFSFHETKNVISGEGGALLVNNQKYIDRAEIIREKGTNRNQFVKGKVDKYTWVDIGSSYLPGEIISAFLMGQLESANKLTARRIRIWNQYHRLLLDLEKESFLRRPIIPEAVTHNAHMYYILLKNKNERSRLITYLKKKEILSVFHYIPLHSSPAGKKYTRISGKLTITNDVAEKLLRLPLFYDMKDSEVEYVARSIKNFFND